MHVVIAGSSGLIGTALRRSLERDGHTVMRLVRRRPRLPGEVSWDHAASQDPRLVDAADVVVNLAGAGLGGHRWTRGYQDILLRSRTETAAALAVMMAAAARPPTVFVSASGMRYYGVDRGDEVLTESTDPASPGFLPMVAQAWEAATEPASTAGISVCHLRLGLVLSRHGGILAQLLPMFRLGLGACFGSEQAFWSYVSLTDTVRAIRFLACHPGARGPYNITTPQPVRSMQFTRTLARALHRPAPLRVPAWVLGMAQGGAAAEVLGSLRVVPARLIGAGFRFEHPDVDSAMHDALSPAT